MPAQVVVAWLRAKESWIVPVFGTRKLERFEENLGALNVSITTEVMREIKKRSAEIAVKGERYPHSYLNFRVVVLSILKSRKSKPAKKGWKRPLLR